MPKPKTKTEVIGQRFTKRLHFKQTRVDEKNFTIYGVFSTGDMDRDGEIIDQSSWILDEFNANPVILFAHDHYQPAVAQGVDIAVVDEGEFTDGKATGKMVLAGGIKFAAEEYDFSMTLFKLYAGLFMRAFSVGFMSNSPEFNPETETWVLRENILYEISCVNVPANAMALALSKGIDMEPVNKFLANQKKDGDSDTEVISASNIKTLRSAIETLTDVLKAATESDKQVVTKRSNTPVVQLQGGNKKISVKTFNTVVRSLLKVRREIVNKK